MEIKQDISNLTFDFNALAEYVKMDISKKDVLQLNYHNWEVTHEHLVTLEKLQSEMDNDPFEFMIARIALYFVRTGQSGSDPKSLEEQRIKAGNYLTDVSFPVNYIPMVIKAMDLKSKPERLSEALVHDVVTLYYGKKKLITTLDQMWAEKNIRGKKKVEWLAYLQGRLDEIKEHSYYTNYVRGKYNRKKIENQKKIQKKIRMIKEGNSLVSNNRAMTMFKTALRNHIDLVNIADKKAGIMISINAILMTLMIPILSNYVLNITHFLVPSIFLIITCGASVILATLATRPQIAEGTVDDISLQKGSKSLFFFGNFFKMKKEDYQEAIKSVIARKGTFENSVINDLFDMGIILGNKYKWLRWCYLVFAVGMGITLFALAVTLIVFYR